MHIFMTVPLFPKAQGGSSIISLKNRLPRVETLATIQHIKMIVQSELAALSLMVINIIPCSEQCCMPAGKRQCELLFNSIELNFENRKLRRMLPSPLGR
jgi:hypothetical protein